MNRPWAAEDIAVVRENMLMPDARLAEKFGRTERAITLLKHRIRRGNGDGKRTDEGRKYDERPSGWYVEVIGTLLLDYEDAYNSWKHYHGYTEVKIMSEDDRRGWTMLLCRRNAVAP